MVAQSGQNLQQQSKLESVEQFTTYKHGGALKSKKTKKQREAEKEQAKNSAVADNQEEKKGNVEEEEDGKAGNEEDSAGDEMGCSDEDEDYTAAEKIIHEAWMASQAASKLREENQKIKSAVSETEEVKVDEDFSNFKEQEFEPESKEEELEIEKRFSGGTPLDDYSEDEIAYFRNRGHLSATGNRPSNGCQIKMRKRKSNK